MNEAEFVGGEQAPGPKLGPGGRVLLLVSKYVAIAGGLVFVAMVVMEIVSIVGRKVFSWTVPGDVELLQMGAAFASAAFFAYCHMVRGDVKVDFFTHNLGTRKVAALDALGSLLVGLFGALIAWRTAAGALGMKVRFELPSDRAVPLSVNRGNPVVLAEESADVSKAVKTMAKELFPAVKEAGKKRRLLPALARS